ncbi:MAG TPA: RDD family protein [Vicinamibacterales bacterium]|nr:RDD family protein [Vicinamibacterales bacterium]
METAPGSRGAHAHGTGRLLARVEEEAAATADAGPAGEARDAASLVRRAAAGLLDLLILASIDVLVVYLTLQVLSLTPGDVRMLPAAPLAAFLLLLNGGYLALFTAAGGQTIGKMSTGIRVVPSAAPAGSHGRVALGPAVVRAAAYFAALLPAGLGFVPILLAADRRGLHDRLAETRVVRA